MLVGDFGKLVEPASSELSELIEMRLHRGAQPRLHVKIEQVAQAVVDAVEVHAAAIRRNEFGGRRELVGIFNRHRKLELIVSR